MGKRRHKQWQSQKWNPSRAAKLTPLQSKESSQSFTPRWLCKLCRASLEAKSTFLSVFMGKAGVNHKRLPVFAWSPFLQTGRQGSSDLCSVAQLWPTLCGPVDYSLPGSSVHGIFQAKILEGVAISFSKGSSQLAYLTSPALAGRFFTTTPPGKLQEIWTIQKCWGLGCQFIKVLWQIWGKGPTRQA